MGLEVGVTRIKNLNSAWPLDTDIRQEGAAHLRNVKLAVQGSFPSLGNGQCTMTAEQLNTVVNALQSFNGRGPFFGDSSAILPEAGDYTLPLMGDVDPGLAPTDNQVLRYVTANTRWEAETLTEATGYAFYNEFDSFQGKEVIFDTEVTNTLSGICTVSNPAAGRGWQLEADVDCLVTVHFSVYYALLGQRAEIGISLNDATDTMPAPTDTDCLDYGILYESPSDTAAAAQTVSASVALSAGDKIHVKNQTSSMISPTGAKLTVIAQAV